jgi:hypothetical protein
LRVQFLQHAHLSGRQLLVSSKKYNNGKPAFEFCRAELAASQLLGTEVGQHPAFAYFAKREFTGQTALAGKNKEYA